MKIACTIVIIMMCLCMVFACVGLLVLMAREISNMLRKPTPREKAEMENTEFDYGHNVKNYTEEDYE